MQAQTVYMWARSHGSPDEEEEFNMKKKIERTFESSSGCASMIHTHAPLLHMQKYITL